MKDGGVLSQILLVHATTKAQEVTQTGPNAFPGMALYCAYALALVIPCPLAVARRVAHTGRAPPGLGHGVVCLPVIGIQVAVSGVRASPQGWRVCRSRWGQPPNRRSPLSRPTTPPMGGRSLSHVPWPLTLFARRRGGSSGSAGLRPFSPALWSLSSAAVPPSCRRGGGQTRLAQRLPLRAVCQPMRSVNPHFSGEMGGGDALRAAAQNQPDRGTALPSLTPTRVGKQGEDCAPGLAPLVHDRGALPILGSVVRRKRMTLRTGQALGVQDRQQVLVAGLLVHQGLDWQYDHVLPSARVMRQLRDTLEDTRIRLKWQLCTSEAT